LRFVASYPSSQTNSLRYSTFKGGDSHLVNQILTSALDPIGRGFTRKVGPASYRRWL